MSQLDCKGIQSSLKSKGYFTAMFGINNSDTRKGHYSGLTFVETLQMCLPSTLDSLSKILICLKLLFCLLTWGFHFSVRKKFPPISVWTLSRHSSFLLQSTDMKLVGLG